MVQTKPLVPLLGNLQHTVSVLSNLYQQLGKGFSCSSMTMTSYTKSFIIKWFSQFGVEEWSNSHLINFHTTCIAELCRFIPDKSSFCYDWSSLSGLHWHLTWHLYLSPSDIAVVEMTDAFRQPSLFYHLGVRESFSMANNIILYCDTNSDSLQSLQVSRHDEHKPGQSVLIT